jgi:hypothetical protein
MAFYGLKTRLILRRIFMIFRSKTRGDALAQSQTTESRADSFGESESRRNSNGQGKNSGKRDNGIRKVF